MTVNNSNNRKALPQTNRPTHAIDRFSPVLGKEERQPGSRLQ